MARFDKSSPKSAKPDVAVAGRGSTKGQSIEDTMFFPRLRRHAKWMFVFLALVFGLGFVIFGVGAGGVGVGDVLRDGGGGEAQSVSDARKQTEESPNDVQAWRDLSLALQTEGETDEAIAALQTAVSLDGGDPDLYRELAGLYLGQVTVRQQEAQRAQLAAAFTGASLNLPGLLTANDQTVLSSPLGRAINAKAAERATTAYTEAGVAATKAVEAYQRVVALSPGDPNVQIELAQAAQQAGNAAVAISAYEQFLELAPDDPSASVVRQQLKQLRQASASSSG